ncbi:MAG: MSCRAMM family protein [archaeon]
MLIVVRENGGINISLKNFYYKIEDKWFAGIDKLDKKGFPAYKMIDPLEKRGIPSLPVFIAFLIIISYILFPYMPWVEPEQTPEPIPEEVTVFITVSNELEKIEDANVEALKEGEFKDSGTTNFEGEASLTLERGKTYKITASKEECTEQEMTYKVPEEEESPTEDISLECDSKLEEGETEICFTPEVSEPIKYEKLGVRDLVLEDGECEAEESGKCFMSLDENVSYSFETDKYISESTYTTSQLEDYEDEECIPMLEKEDDDPNDDIESEVGEEIIWVKDEEGNSLGGKTVQLVYPNETNTHIVEGKTSESEGSVGRVTLKPPLEEEYKIKVLSGEETSSKLTEEIYEVTKSAETRHVTVGKHEETDIEVVSSRDAAPLEGTHIRIFDDGEEVYESQTNSKGKADPMPNLQGHTYEATLFKQGYAAKEIEITGGESRAFELDGLEDHEMADVEITAKTNTETQERVQEAKVDLKYEDGGQMGYPTKETNDLGEVKFPKVPEGDYCAELTYEGKTYPCENHSITVRPEEESVATRTILIDPIMRLLRVRITREDEGIEGVTIKGKDKFGQTYTPKETDTGGMTSFRVPDGRLVSVSAEATVEGEEFRPTEDVRMDNDETIEFELDEPIDRDVVFNQLTENKGDQYEEGERINPNTWYDAEFQMDLSNVMEERWNEVEYNIWTEDDINIYKSPEVNSWTGWGANSEDLPGKNQEITIEGNYDKEDTEPIFNVPIVALPKDSSDEKIELNFQANWKHEESDTYIETEEETIEFELNHGEGSRQGPFYVDRTISREEPVDPEQPVTAFWNISLVEGVFDGEMVFEPEFNNTEFDPVELEKLEKTNPEGEKTDLTEEVALREDYLAFNFTEENQLEEGDHLELQMINTPKYPSSDVKIQGKAGEIDLGHIKYETGGKISTTTTLSEGSRYTLSDHVEMTIKDKERGSVLEGNELVNIKRHEDSKITGSLQGCNEIPLSKAEIAQDEEGRNVLRVDLDSDCHLKEGEIDVSIAGGDIKEDTSSFEIEPTFTIQRIGQTGIVPGETCPIDLTKQGTEEVSIGAPGEESIGIARSECEEERPSEMGISYAEAAGIEPENLEVDEESVELESADKDQISNEILRRFVDIDVKQDRITLEPEAFEGGEGYDFQVKFTMKGTNNDITDEETITTDISLSQPMRELGGNRFRRNLVQSYDAEEYRCNVRYCNLDQIFEYGIKDSPTTRSEVLMVEMGGITPSIAASILTDTLEGMEELEDEDWEVRTGEPEDTITSENEFIIDGNPENMPDVGRNEMVVANETDDDGNTQYHIWFNHLDDENPLLVENIALWMPHQQISYGELNKTNVLEKQMETPIYIDETIEEEVYREEIEKDIQEALGGMWGVDKENFPVKEQEEEFEGYEHGIHIGLCPEGEPEHENCQRLEDKNYSLGKPAIFRGGFESRTYIHARNEGDLLNLTERFELAFGEARSGLALEMMNKDDPTLGGLTLAPEEIKYYCWSQGAPNCPGGEETLNALEQLGETMLGAPAVELEQEKDFEEILIEDEKEVDFIITSSDNTKDLRRSGQLGSNPYISGSGGYIDIFGKGVRSKRVRLPPGGILYQPDGPTTLLVPEDNGANAPDLLQELHFQLTVGEE